MSLSNKMAKADYMGDPGLFGDIWSGIKKVGGLATGIVGGLGIPIVSGVARTAGSILFGARNTIPGASTFATPPPPMSINTATGVQSLPGLGNFPVLRMQGQVPTPGFIGGMQRLIPGGATGMQAGPVAPAVAGYHWNKTGYYTKSDGWIEPFSRMVKNRKRNPGNMRALSRCMGRIKSAKKMAAVLGTITIRKSC